MRERRHDRRHDRGLDVRQAQVAQSAAGSRERWRGRRRWRARSVATRQCSTSSSSAEHPDVRLGVADIDREQHAARLSPRSGAPIAWKPPSTCRISPVMPRATSPRAGTDGVRDRRRIVDGPSPAGPASAKRRRACRSPGCRRRPGSPPGPRTRGSRAPRRRPGRARGSARPTPGRPSRRPSSRRPARRRRRRSPCPRARRRSLHNGSRASASALNEYALVRKASSADSGGALMNLPPSASPGANAIACSAPSRPPQRDSSSAPSASKSSGLLTSSSSTSGGSGSLAAARSVMRRVRPKPVSTISAPASCWRARPRRRRWPLA